MESRKKIQQNELIFLHPFGVDEECDDARLSLSGNKINQDETMTFSCTFQQFLLQRLQFPTKKVRMVLDTDTYNEIDDQFALVYAALPRKAER